MPVDHSTFFCFLIQVAVCAEARTLVVVYSEALWRDLAKWCWVWLIPPESYHGHCYDKEDMGSGDVGSIFVPPIKEYMVPERSDGGAPFCELGPQLLPLYMPAQMQLHLIKGAFNKWWLTWVPLMIFGTLLIFCNHSLSLFLARKHKPWEVL